MLCSLAGKLEPGDLAAIGGLEEELGVTLLAYSCMPLEPAPIDDAKLGRIKDLEERLGVSLVAVGQ
jgi:hypothetical protein